MSVESRVRKINLRISCVRDTLEIQSDGYAPLGLAIPSAQWDVGYPFNSDDDLFRDVNDSVDYTLDVRE